MKLRIYLKSGPYIDALTTEEKRSFREVMENVTTIGVYVNEGVWVPRENISLIMDTSNGVDDINNASMKMRN